jgi:DNA-binding GntR family transcriptional regulator
MSPGERLSIPALATELGVSRSPIREAVRQLVQHGLAVEEPHRGAFVAHVTLADLQRVYAVREVLEGLAARSAAEMVSPADLEELEDLLAQHRDAVERGDMEAHFDLDMRFHRHMRVLTGNESLVAFLDQIQGQIQLGMLTTSVRGGAPHAVQDHERILAAVVSRDPEAAEQAARAHIARLRVTLETSDVRHDDD